MEDSRAGVGPQPNAADPVQVMAATKQREWIASEDANDLRKVFQSDEGKRFLLRLMDEIRVFLDPFNRDPLQMAHDVGYQEVGRTLIKWLGQADPTAFPTLLMYRLQQDRDREADRLRLNAQKKTN